MNDIPTGAPAARRMASSHEVNAATVQTLDALTLLLVDLRWLVKTAIEAINEAREEK